ncbi:MAG: superoxide dismutase family protein [Novosphingobium sp.]|nr:superoxide dismutase family protein [Novosphingobium sp.]
MKPTSLLTLIAAAALVSACASLGDIPDRRLASAALGHANGSPAGTVIITAAGDKVTIAIAVVGLPQGPHGMHLHKVGKCEAPGFTSAGPHLNPNSAQHGIANPAGSHLGDLPNITANSPGAGAVSAALPGTRAELEAALFDADGTAVVVHADPDDYRTDPSGNSGARIACGVLKRA